MSRLGLRLTPHGRLSVEDQDDGPDIDAAASIRLIDAFARGTGYGLVWLGAAEVGQALPPLFVWWRDFAALYVGSLCLHASGMEAEGSRKLPSVPAPTAAELSSLVLTAPIMAGAEYLTQDVLLALWDEMERAFAASLAAAKVGLQAFLTTLNRAWNLVGRVHFNLAENRRDPDQPFAFMATYTTRLSAQAKVQHVPLGQALREYAGAANRDKLLSLLLPVQRAAEHCAWLKPMIDAGDIFHPLRWGPTEASRFLQSVPELESAGVVVRMPVSWRASRPARPQVTATVGSRAPSAVGLDGLLDFQMGVMLDGEPLTEVEVATLLAGTENLVLLRGQWVEVDRARLQRTMEQFHAAEELAARDGLTFAEAMRMLAGAGVTRDDPAAADTGWARVTAGPWLEQTLKELRAPDGDGVDPAQRCRGRCVPTRKREPDGWTCWQALVSAPAWPTTWVSGRQSRCYLCCWWNRRAAPVPGRAYWWRQPPCWPTGQRRSKNSPPA
jgi:SNF2 Helicase protein